jgi:hypothetical protein
VGARRFQGAEDAIRRGDGCAELPSRLGVWQTQPEGVQPPCRCGTQGHTKTLWTVAYPNQCDCCDNAHVHARVCELRRGTGGKHCTAELGSTNGGDSTCAVGGRGNTVQELGWARGIGEKEGWNAGKRSAANVNANGRDVGMEDLQPGVDNGSDGYDG